MKVYQVNVVGGYGSTGRIAADLAQIIEREGGNCRIAYGRGGAPENVDFFKSSQDMEVYAHVLMTRLTDKHGLYSKKATRRLIEDICNYEPDVIHLHNIHGYYLNYEIFFRFLKEYGRPVVWSLHDCWAFTGHCAHFDYIGCDKWRQGCFKCPQKNQYPNSILLDNSSENYKRKKEAFQQVPSLTIVTVSEWLKSVAEQSFLKEYAINKISNGIDLSVMHPMESDLREKYHLVNKKIILGVASFWHERKGLYAFYELAKMISKEYQIVLIGVHKDKKSEMPGNILDIGKITDAQELVKWYTTADVYVNTSVEESMGLTTVEAMACGTPVVVMNATANPELVNKTCGRIVEPGNIEQLWSAIQSIVNVLEMKENCIKQAYEFEKTKQYKKYIELYKTILAEAEK